ncbi:type VII secretion integral membrane protein EccD [Mycobacterium asiaticum]|uniref:Type VII secretion integral membrane protein EccD n=1 Tax=Mycobacterium asiaticum TaxID=1790 RepID=A0A1A3P2Y3_MYCAS|nr:type VII secretion integral membrane protein EccD [Mycobacterium asiaticum]OBK28536.1 type VII secretion integral membrane protein EccD [Mycobacterium asiaticum]
MPASNPVLRRVTVHADSANIDVALPATLPVAELIPSILDLLGGVAPAANYRLSRLGAPPLPSSATLAHSDIKDGTVLIMSREAPRPPVMRCDEEADTVAATLNNQSRALPAARIMAAVAAVCFSCIGAIVLVRNASTTDGHARIAVATVAAVAVVCALFADRLLRNRVAALTLNIIAVVHASLAGLLTVPGGPGAPNVLLAGMAGAATAVLAMRVTRCDITILMTLAWFAVIGASAALATMLTGAPPYVVGSLTALSCLALIEAAPRASILLTGLSPNLTDSEPLRTEGELAAKAQRADSVLTGLRSAFAAGAASGSAVAALTAQRGIALAAVAAGVLLLHARSDSRRAPVFVGCGIALTATVFVIAANTFPIPGMWVAALTTILSAAAVYLGFVVPVISLSPVMRRCIDALGCVASIAVVPLTFWTCGAFGVVRRLNLMRA